MILKLNRIQRGKVKAILAKKCYPDFVIEGGLERELKEWKIFVKWCQNGYDFTIEEYRNDLDKRTVIKNILDDLDDKELIRRVLNYLEPIDEQFKKLLIETDKCVWSSRLANRYIPKERYWWYWGIVKNARGELLKSLQQSEFKFYRKYKEKRK